MENKRSAGYPYGEFDAHKWAEEFVRLFPNTVEEDTMTGWFANAIMTGYDKAHQSDKVISIERLADHIADVCGPIQGADWEGAAKGLDFLLLSDGYEIRKR